MIALTENHEALSFEDLEKSVQIQSDISSMLNVSPPSWQVKRKSTEDLSNNSVRSLKSRYKKAKCALKEKFAESVAPGQASNLADILSSSDEDENTARLSNDTAALLQVYKNNDKFRKLVSLTSKTLSKSSIMETFDCSKRQVENARSLQIDFDRIYVPENIKHH